MIRLKIKRCDRPQAESYWEEFDIPFDSPTTLIGALRALQKHPYNSNGKAVVPVAWDDDCAAVCSGACTVLINGRAHSACDFAVAPHSGVVRVEPLSKFPVVRDLIVNRAKVFAALQHVQSWVSLDGSFDIGPGPRYADAERRAAAAFAVCTSCACCLEACPQYFEKSNFLGAAAINRVHFLNQHPQSKKQTPERLEAILDDTGLAGCDNAQNCVRACPQSIPLTTAIAKMQRLATKRVLNL